MSAINCSHNYPLIIFLYSKFKIDNMPPCYKEIHLELKKSYFLFWTNSQSFGRFWWIPLIQSKILVSELANSRSNNLRPVPWDPSILSDIFHKLCPRFNFRHFTDISEHFWYCATHHLATIMDSSHSDINKIRKPGMRKVDDNDVREKVW